jgi:serine/threonine protein kinase
MEITKLKGGSLSSTSVIQDGDRKFVRKECQAVAMREYGYMRWYSQLKKLQHISSLYPTLVPRLDGVGLQHEGRSVYFDMEYLEGFTDIKTLLVSGNLSNDQIKKMSAAVWRALDKIHSNKKQAISGGPSLYFREEVRQKLEDALRVKEFADFYAIGEFEFHRKTVPGIQKYSKDIQSFFDKLVLNSEELIHGNPTLENMMYSIEDDAVVFIDVYEESCIDSRLLDYAQVLQCSESHYGIINDGEVHVEYNRVWHDITVPDAVWKFNASFGNEMSQRLSGVEFDAIDVLEATQFIRMLPFKLHSGDRDKAKYFYVYACNLFDRIFG